MKAKLEFDLDDPHERKAHMRCIKATKAYLALHEIDNKLREYVKYNKDIEPGSKWALPTAYHELSDTESHLMWHFAEKIRGEINYIVRDLGVDLDDLD